MHLFTMPCFDHRSCHGSTFAQLRWCSWSAVRCLQLPATLAQKGSGHTTAPTHSCPITACLGHARGPHHPSSQRQTFEDLQHSENPQLHLLRGHSYCGSRPCCYPAPTTNAPSMKLLVPWLTQRCEQLPLGAEGHLQPARQCPHRALQAQPPPDPGPCLEHVRGLGGHPSHGRHWSPLLQGAAILSLVFPFFGGGAWLGLVNFNGVLCGAAPSLSWADPSHPRAASVCSHHQYRFASMHLWGLLFAAGMCMCCAVPGLARLARPM